MRRGLISVGLFIAFVAIFWRSVATWSTRATHDHDDNLTNDDDRTHHDLNGGDERRL